MEGLESTVALEKILHLVLCILLGQSTDEKLTWAIIHLCRDNAHRDGVNHWHRPARLNLRVLVELRRASDAQHNIVVADAVQLDGC